MLDSVIKEFIKSGHTLSLDGPNTGYDADLHRHMNGYYDNVKMKSIGSKVWPHPGPAPTKGKNPKDLAEIIMRVIVNREQTSWANSPYKGTMQEPKGKKRSIIDTYMVARTYLPKVSFETVTKAVRALYTPKHGHMGGDSGSKIENFQAGPEGKDLIGASYCYGTGRVVHYKNTKAGVEVTEEKIRKVLEDLKLNRKCTKAKVQSTS